MSPKTIMSATALATVLSFGVAGAQSPAPPAPPAGHHLRGERGSARNLLSVRRHLERLIDQMQRDQHDYNGLRVKAIQDLQNARQDIIQAIQYDATHPGQ